MPHTVTAREDGSLSATVLTSAALRYGDGPDDALDRPGFVRAASVLLRSSHGVVVIQDDANFIAVLDADLRGHAIALPAGEGGLRQFDDVRGNKRYKLDLEAGVVAPDERGGELLAAFGSGSSPLREQVVLVEELAATEPRVSLVAAHALYRSLRELRAFSGSELNVEGAVYDAGRLLLFNRGNGAPRGGLRPVNAVCSLPWLALLASLRDLGEPPAPSLVAQYDLGALAGQPLTFTDAAATRGALLYSAAAEDSPDAVRDGPVVGSAIGVIAGGEARWAPLRAADGALFAGKVEGLLPDLNDPTRLLVVVDRDDPAAPSEMCEVELGGPWL